MSPRYAAVDGIRTLDFGDECVVFNPLSWDAHILNAAAALVLDLLGGEAQGTDEVAAVLRDVLVDSERTEAPAHARRLIHELMELGLVYTVQDDGAADR